MELRLLGTGAANGWPSPWCSCASCRWAREAGTSRAHTCVLVDEHLLVDLGGEAAIAASRLGVSLAPVDTLLLTHWHADHTAGLPLVTRRWARRTEPLLVAGPASALAMLDAWVADDDPITLRPVAAGDEFEAGGVAVRALAANHGPDTVVYDLTTPDGGRLLHACDTGRLPAETLAAAAGRAYDVVLLDETWGDDVVHDHHLGLDGFAATVADLRRVGAVTPSTRVVAIHVGHGNPPGPELERRLAAMGAEVLPDGAVLGDSRPAPVGRRVLLLGGNRSGKSLEAERRLAAEPDVPYVATWLDGQDDEWAERVRTHRARRPAHWRTVETLDLAGVLRATPAGGPALLVDCVNAWLAGTMSAAGCWDDPQAPKRLAAAVDELVAAWSATEARVVAVTNEVGMSLVPTTRSGRWFVEQLGTLNARMAAAADEVWQVVAGIPSRLR